MNPQSFRWDADRAVMVPLRRNSALKYYVDGQTYTLEDVQERSASSHAHYFAQLHECWLNLPEREAERFVSEDHFRKYCLIRCGFYTTQDVVCQTRAEAERVAGFARRTSPYAVVTIKDKTVTAFEARSQSYRTMTKQEFQDSKTKVLDFAASLIGTSRKELEQNAGASA